MAFLQTVNRVKRSWAVILVICYFAYVANITVYQHYCMGELVSTSMFPVTDSACSKCGMDRHTEKNKDCCKDVSVSVSTGEPHLYANACLTEPAKYFELTPSLYFVLIYPIEEPVASETPYLLQAPALYKRPLYLQHRNFRI